MRAAVFTLLFGIGLVIVAAGRNGWSQPSPQRSAANSSSQLIAFSKEMGTSHQLVLIDSQERVMGVYHVNRETGEIALKSVRRINWDLLMEEFNATSPSPREIRALLEQR